VGIENGWMDLERAQSLHFPANIIEMHTARKWLSITCRKTSAVSYPDLVLLEFRSRRDKNTI